MRELDLIRVEPSGDDLVISDVSDEEGWRTVKELLLKSVGMGSVPVIRVEDADFGGNRTLLLSHAHDGRDLQLENAERTLAYVHRLWGREVVLETLMNGKHAHADATARRASRPRRRSSRHGAAPPGGGEPAACRYNPPAMPIYEYRCAGCGAKVTVLTLRVSEAVTPSASTAAAPSWPASCRASRCSAPTTIAWMISRTTPPGVDENDPKSVARWMRSMGKELGEDAGEDFDEMVDDLERGSGADPMPMPTAGDEV